MHFRFKNVSYPAHTVKENITSKTINSKAEDAHFWILTITLDAFPF